MASDSVINLLRTVTLVPHILLVRVKAIYLYFLFKSLSKLLCFCANPSFQVKRQINKPHIRLENNVSASCLEIGNWLQFLKDTPLGFAQDFSTN